jgi:tetratricopeptide (TPR) repeat protein
MASMMDVDVAAGEVFLALGEVEAARRIFQMMLAEYERDVRALADMAECLAAEGALAEAKPFLDKVLASDALSHDLLRSMASWCFEQGQHEDAMRYAAVILSTQPDDVDMLVLLVNEECRLGEFEKAAPFCRRLMALRQGDPKIQQLWDMLAPYEKPAHRTP